VAEFPQAVSRELDKIVMKIFWIFVIIVVVMGFNFAALEFIIEKETLDITWHLRDVLDAIYTAGGIASYIFLLITFLFFRSLIYCFTFLVSFVKTPITASSRESRSHLYRQGRLSTISGDG